MTTNLYATFVINDYLFGVQATEVQEVLAHQRLTEVPSAPSQVVGLMNLRGLVVVALDLRDRLGLPPVTPGSTMVNVVLRSQAGPVAVLVDRVADVLEIDDDAIDPVPITLDLPAELVTGVYQREGQIILLLDGNEITMPVAS